MKKMLFVYNPRSGKGLIKNHLSAILETFSAADYEVTVYPTRQGKDALHCCRRARAAVRHGCVQRRRWNA